MKQMKKNLILAFILVPAAAYPFYAGIFFLSDIFLGDRILLRQLHETRRFLWNTFWGDYAHSLPVFYGLALVLFVLPTVISQRYILQLFWLPIFLGLLFGGGIGVYLSDMTWGWLTLLHAIIGAVLGLLFSSIAHRQRDH